MANRYDKRKWLNPKRSNNSGAVQWGAELDYGYLNMDMGIWDCSRKIVLDFGFGTENGRQVVLTKIAIMQEALNDLKWTAQHVELDDETETSGD